MYGVEVFGENFVDREQELKELRQELLSGKSVLMLTPRRIGKSSLIAEFSRRLGEKAILVHIKLYEVDSETALAERIVETVLAAAYGRIERAIKSATKFLSSLRPSFTTTPDGLKVSIAREITPPEMAEALELPEMVAKEKRKRVIIAFDEFQEILHFNGLKLEKLMKAKFERHAHASYIFAGSKRRLLLEMFSREDRPLFRFAKPMELGRIPLKEFKRFIIEKFHKAGGSIREEIAGKILDYTEGHPYFTQQLCHEIWNLNKNVRDASIIEEAIDRIIAHHSAEYEQIWDLLRGRGQRNLLRGMSLEPDANIFSARFIERYGMRSASHVKKAYDALEKKGIVERIPPDKMGKIGDIFFAEWIRRLSRR